MSSLGEQKIAVILTAANFKFQREYEFPDLVASSGRPLRFDFAVFNDDDTIAFLIEYDGEQHYKGVGHFGGKSAYARQHHNDMEKNKYCALHGYTLVRVPYYDYDKLSLEYLLAKADFF